MSGRHAEALARRSGRTLHPYHIPLLLAASAVAFLAANLSWLITIALPPRDYPAHWVQRSASAANKGKPEPFCFDITHAQDDQYRRAAARDQPTQRMVFCEDVQMLHGAGLDGWAMMSCDPGRPRWNTVMGPMLNPEPRGALWIYPYAEAAFQHNSGLQAVSPVLLPFIGFPDDADFHPLGFAVLPASATREHARLFVVNHGRQRATIEVFDLHKGAADEEGKEGDASWSAHHVRTLVHPLATHTPNSIVALSPNELLVTQDHFFALHPAPIAQLRKTYAAIVKPYLADALARMASSKPVRALMPRIETSLGLPLSFVAHLRFIDSAPFPDAGVEADIVADGISFANGIAQSPNGNVIAVASTLMPGVLLYRLERQSGKVQLTLLDKVHTPNLADNVAFSVPSGDQAPPSDEVDVFGAGATLLASGSTSGPQLIAFARDPGNVKKAAPSWVVGIAPVALNAKDSDADGAAAYSSSRRIVKKNARYTVKTLYQGQKPELAAQAYKQKHVHVGIASSSTGAYDPVVGNGTLLVSGLYSDPGIMVCFNVGH